MDSPKIIENKILCERRLEKAEQLLNVLKTAFQTQAPGAPTQEELLKWSKRLRQFRDDLEEKIAYPVKELRELLNELEERQDEIEFAQSSTSSKKIESLFLHEEAFSPKNSQQPIKNQFTMFQGNVSLDLKTNSGAPKFIMAETYHEHAKEKPPEPLGQTWHMPNKLPTFIGRKSLLEDLCEHLSQGMMQTASVVLTACHGLGGIGKSSLVLQFAYMHLDQYQHVFWFNAQDAETLRNDHLTLAQRLGYGGLETKEQIYRVKEWFQKNTGCLLIFDNAKNHETIKSYLPQTGHYILITSRYNVWPKIPNFSLDVFDSDESRAYIQEMLRETHDFNQEENSDYVDELSNVLGHLPLALSQACGYLQQATGVSIKEYLMLYQNNKKLYLKVKNFEEEGNNDLLQTLEKKDKETLEENKDRIYVTWTITRQMIEKSSHCARQLLEMTACLHHQKIPIDIFKEYSKNLGLEGDVGTIKLEQNLNLLEQYSLIQIERDDKQKIIFITLHVLLQEVMHLQLSKENFEHYLLSASKGMNAIYPMSDKTVFAMNVKKQLLPHLERLKESIIRVIQSSSNLSSISLPPVVVQSLFFCLENAYDVVGNYKKRREHLLEMLSDKKIIPGKTDIVSLTFALDHLCIAELNCGHIEKAKECGIQLLLLKKQYYDEQDLRFAPTLNTLGNVALSLGHLDEAESYYRQALALYKQHDSENHFELAPILLNLGLVAQKFGQFDTAKKHLLKALARYKRYYGKQHPELAGPLNNLGAVAKDLGKFDEAEGYYLQALELYKQRYGEQHPELARTLNNLGFVAETLNKLDIAKDYYLQALRLLKERYGNSHPEHADVLNNLGNLAQRLKKFREGEDYLLQSLELQKQRYGDDHPELAQTYNALGCAAQDGSRFAKAEEYYLKALELKKKHYGDTHPVLADVLNNLGNVAQHLNQLTKAKEYLLQALAIQLPHYDENHLELIATLKFLAHVKVQLGDIEGGYLLANRTYRLLNKHLFAGPNHSDTQEAHNLLKRVTPFYQKKYLQNYKSLETQNKFFLKQGREANQAGIQNYRSQDYSQAISLFEKAMDYFRLVEKDLNDNVEYHTELASILLNLGSAYLAEKKYPLSTIYWLEECLKIKKDKLQQSGPLLDKVNGKLKQAQELLEKQKQEEKRKSPKHTTERQTDSLPKEEIPSKLVPSSKMPLIHHDSSLLSKKLEQEQEKQKQLYIQKLEKARQLLDSLRDIIQKGETKLVSFNDLIEWGSTFDGYQNALQNNKPYPIEELRNFIQMLQTGIDKTDLEQSRVFTSNQTEITTGTDNMKLSEEMQQICKNKIEKTKKILNKLIDDVLQQEWAIWHSTLKKCKRMMEDGKDPLMDLEQLLDVLTQRKSNIKFEQKRSSSNKKEMPKNPQPSLNIKESISLNKESSFSKDSKQPFKNQFNMFHGNSSLDLKTTSGNPMFIMTDTYNEHSIEKSNPQQIKLEILQQEKNKQLCEKWLDEATQLLGSFRVRLRLSMSSIDEETIKEWSHTIQDYALQMEEETYPVAKLKDLLMKLRTVEKEKKMQPKKDVFLKQTQHESIIHSTTSERSVSEHSEMTSLDFTIYQQDFQYISEYCHPENSNTKGWKYVEKFLKLKDELNQDARRINDLPKNVPELWKKNHIHGLMFLTKKIQKFLDKLPKTTLETGARHNIRNMLNRLNEHVHSFIEAKSNSKIERYTRNLKLEQEIRNLQACLQGIKEFYKKHDYLKPTCFICYAWPLEIEAKNPETGNQTQFVYPKEAWIQDFLRNLHKDLTDAGIKVYLDIIDNPYGGNIYKFMEQGSASDFVLLMGTRSLKRKHEQGMSAVCTELNLIQKKRVEDMKIGFSPRVFPISLDGYLDAFPISYMLYSTIRNWQSKTYINNLKDLTQHLYEAGPHNSDYEKLWTPMQRELMKPIDEEPLESSNSNLSTSEFTMFYQKKTKEKNENNIEKPEPNLQNTFDTNEILTLNPNLNKKN